MQDHAKEHGDNARHKKDEALKEEKGLKEDRSVTIKEEDYLKLKEEAEKSREYWDRLLRLQADFDNTRKRLEREKQDFVKFANEGLILELLNVLDDLERTVESAQSRHQDVTAFLKGVEMILAHLYEMLKEHGVRPMESLGKVFDPDYHEALMQAEDKDLPEHTIVEELQKGYLLNDRVIRTAKVKVSKNTSVPGEGDKK
ncbi:MAG: nucleotide exchange factor GrpE [Candidatus Omnitrophota bacterium]